MSSDPARDVDSAMNGNVRTGSERGKQLPLNVPFATPGAAAASTARSNRTSTAKSKAKASKSREDGTPLGPRVTTRASAARALTDEATPVVDNGKGKGKLTSLATKKTVKIHQENAMAPPQSISYDAPAPTPDHHDVAPTMATAGEMGMLLQTTKISGSLQDLAITDRWLAKIAELTRAVQAAEDARMDDKEKNAIETRYLDEQHFIATAALRNAQIKFYNSQEVIPAVSPTSVDEGQETKMSTLHSPAMRQSDDTANEDVPPTLDPSAWTLLDTSFDSLKSEGEDPEMKCILNGSQSTFSTARDAAQRPSTGSDPGATATQDCETTLASMLFAFPLHEAVATGEAIISVPAPEEHDNGVASDPQAILSSF